ncbi:peptidoglycan-binding domain-containing protein [Bacillus sp. JCM 19041]|uniref:peptidoglycan-binding domain-containing protein n=1 Tax=Bacillus sp. JCM 19041 TaxID=1460637 RepID=UPI0006D20464
MKKKWLMIVPAIALTAAPIHLQATEASAKEMVQMSEIPPELEPILAVAPEHQPTLKNGSVSVEVELVQVKLSHFGYETDRDGIFGNETEQQIRQFQQDYDLEVDGVVGVHTWTELIGEDRVSFTVEDAITFAEEELNNDDLIFSGDGILHEDSDGNTFYSLRASSQDLIDGGGSGTVGFYDVYSDGSVEESEPR